MTARVYAPGCASVGHMNMVRGTPIAARACCVQRYSAGTKRPDLLCLWILRNALDDSVTESGRQCQFQLKILFEDE